MSEITATKEQQNKYEALKEYLRSLGSVAVAFSSGVDSTFLLKTAHDVLGDKCIAITAMSCSFPKRELEEAKTFCVRETFLVLRKNSSRPSFFSRVLIPWLTADWEMNSWREASEKLKVVAT